MDKKNGGKAARKDRGAVSGMCSGAVALGREDRGAGSGKCSGTVALGRESRDAETVEAGEGAAEKAAEKAAWRKRVKNKRDYIARLLKGEGKYWPEMSVQVNVLAQLCVKMDKYYEETICEDPITVEISREGSPREGVSAKEKLYLDYVDRVQKALKSLGMNMDSKDRRAEDDGFNNFLKEFGEGD